jgi:hypothetical protein
MKRVPLIAAVAALSVAGCRSTLIDSAEPLGCATIGPAGGTVRDGAVTLKILAGALASTQQICIANLPHAPPLPSGEMLRGSAYALTPSGLTFAKDAVLKLPVPQTSGSYRVLWLNDASDTAWKAAPTFQISSSTATISLSHFSVYAIAEADGGCGKSNGGCASSATCSQSGDTIACACPPGDEGDGLTCVSTADADAAYCAQQGAHCGTITRTDAWGVQHTANCGTCAHDAICGLFVANACSPTAAAFCSEAGKNCGTYTGTDPTGRSRTESCGTCDGNDTCGAEVPNVCGCASETDAQLCTRDGFQCGTVEVTDQCGVSRSINCGDCPGGVPCGSARPNICCEPEGVDALCSSNSAECGSLTAVDNCGVSRTVECGGCSNGSLCGVATANACQCVPQTDAQLCTAAGAQCGSKTVVDNCGATRTVQCGTCTSGECGATEPNQCPCVAETDLQLCFSAGAQCGSITARDNCGTTRTVQCGGCTNGAQCGAYGPNLCQCIPEDDATLCTHANAQCGSLTVTDNCGTSRTVDCGTCMNGPCAANLCPCMPESGALLCTELGAQCGTLSAVDVCGSSVTVACGGCQSGLQCGAEAPNQCPCVPESDQDLCTANGAQCGSLTATDNCGSSRTVACGTCPSGVECGDAQPNVCGCLSESDSALCASASAQCGMLTAPDNCGVQRTVDCGICTNGGDCGTTRDNVCTCVPETDQQLCTSAYASCGQITAPDNCGVTRTVSCGTCASGSTCGAERPNSCGCIPEADTALCTAAGAQCGSLTTTDNCGTSRTVSCGTCSGGATCGGQHPNVCTCVPESDGQLCTTAGAQCGALTAVDNCGTSRTVSCGECMTGGTCGAATPNICGCVPEADSVFCASVNAQCGSFTGPDNCGELRTASCGLCPGSEQCGASVPNVCGCASPTPEQLCAEHAAQCGMLTTIDTCGAQRSVPCGTCADGETCGATTPNVCGCVAEPDSTLCASAGAQCGMLTAPDNCGNERTVDCGGCADGGVCGATAANSCSCTPESNQVLCARGEATCGSIVTTDNCGNPRTVDCGTCPDAGNCGLDGGSCTCVPDTDQMLCFRAMAQCGPLETTDNCGYPRTINCGSCPDAGTCGVDGGNVPCAMPPG